MTVVAQHDLQHVSDVLDAVSAAPPAPGRLPQAVLAALLALVPGDEVSYNDLDVASRTFHAIDEHDGTRATSLAEPEQEPDDPFWRHYEDSPFCSYPTATGDHRTVTMRGDFHSGREWRQTAMHADVCAGDGVTDELLCPLTGVGMRSRRLLFARCGGPGYSERDRLVMTLLRPHLAEALRATARAPRAELTRRQMELMHHVAAGRSNAEIAAAIFVSPHTVRKHLENVFERLDVSSRTAAVAKVFG